MGTEFMFNPDGIITTRGFDQTPHTLIKSIVVDRSYNGVNLGIGTDNMPVTLTREAGVTFRFQNIGSAGNNNMRIIPPTGKIISGMGLNNGRVADLQLDHTKSTAKTGDYVELYSDKEGNWVIMGMEGDFTMVS